MKNPLTRYSFFLALVAVVVMGIAPSPAEESAMAAPWPPAVDEVFPDLELRRLDGTPFQLKSLEGKPLLVEYVGMSCAGCQAFLGGNKDGVGGFNNCTPQNGLGAISQYLPQFANDLRIDDERFTSVVILFYGLDMGAPTLEDANAFAQHFSLESAANHVVLVGDARYIRGETYALIPGFQVVDRDFILRSDATGGSAGQLWDKTLPLLATLVGQE